MDSGNPFMVQAVSSTQAAEDAKLSKPSAVQAYQYLRDICSWRLMTHDAPLLLGGPGVAIQIDESLFCHKPKVREKREKYLLCYTYIYNTM